jgi:predicted GH43/DUF377 family glycosyl hydrolase
MKNIFYVIIGLSVISLSCRQDPHSTETSVPNSSGKISFSFDKANAPSEVATLTTLLTRSGFQSRQKVVNILHDTAASILFEQVEVGLWSIQIDAKNDSGKILYTGKSDVTVFENFVSQVNIVLTKIADGMGSVQINIKWGSSEYGEWEEYTSNPILSKPENIIMSSGIFLPKVMFINNMYYMWYNMSTSQGGVGFATSFDGKKWEHQSKQSIIAVGESGSWDGTAVGIGAIIYENGLFKMFFNAYDQTKKFRIGYAFSSDGLHWQKHSSPVFEGASIWNFSTVSSAIIKNDSGYFLYYSARPISSNDYVIGMAFSKDGMKFQDTYNKPVMYPTQTWEAKSIYWPSIIKDKDQYIMIYMNGSGGTKSAFGIAKSIDGIQWQKLSSNPVYSWSKYHTAWSITEIAYPFLIKTGTEIRLYYAGYSPSGYTIGYAVNK